VKRGDLYRVRRPPSDPRPARVFVVVSRHTLLAARFSTASCAPVFTRRDGLATQVDIGVDEGMKHDSTIHCDELVSLPKTALTDYISSLSPSRLQALDDALRVALDLA